jgi:hypothetical protein
MAKNKQKTWRFPDNGPVTPRGSSNGGVSTSAYTGLCNHVPKPVKCGDTQIYGSGRRYLSLPGGLMNFDFAIPLGAEFDLRTFIGYTGFLIPFPIKDFTAPNPDLLRLYAERMIHFARAGNKVVTFCEGSHGRTGLVLAACIGVAEPDCKDPVEAVRERHCRKSCETNDQIKAVFHALDRPVPQKYRTGGGSKTFSSFTTTQTTGWDGAVDVPRPMNVLPAASDTGTYKDPGGRVLKSSGDGVPGYPPGHPMAKQPPLPKPVGFDEAPPDDYFDDDGTMDAEEGVEVDVFAGPNPDEPAADQSDNIPLPTVEGGEPTPQPDPFLFTQDWALQHKRRLLIPALAIAPTQRPASHPTKGYMCAVCLTWCKDPSRLALSRVNGRIHIHHLDCDEQSAKSKPSLTKPRSEFLAKHSPELWKVYRDKRKHRRKRAKRKQRHGDPRIL